MSATACEDDLDASFRLIFFGKDPGASLELWQTIPGTKTATYYASKRFRPDWLSWSSAAGSLAEEIYAGPRNFSVTAEKTPIQ